MAEARDDNERLKILEARRNSPREFPTVSKDEEIVEKSKQIIAQAYNDAAAALVQAGFVEPRTIDGVAAIIAMVLEKGDPQEEA